MYRTLITLLALLWAARVGFAEDGASIKFPSPDGRFALRISGPTADEYAERKADLIEKTSGKVMVDLGTASPDHLSETVLVWSADSKWVAYGTRWNQTGETIVYFWNGSSFENIGLPADLPDPDIKFRKGEDERRLKIYGGAVQPVRWLKSGELELSSDLMMLSRVDGRTYTGVVPITIAFDSQHHASVQKVGKTKTRVDQ